MAQNQKANKLGQALFLARQGMHVFPLQPGKRIPVGGCEQCRISPDRPSLPHRAEECECIPAGRHCHGAHAATTDPDVIRRWWNPSGRNAAAGIGIHLAKSGLVVIDLDAHGGAAPAADKVLPGLTRRVSAGLVPGDGWDTYAMLCAERGRDAPWEDVRQGVMVRTPSGGLHVWYRVQHPERYRNTDGKLGWQVDFKAGAAFAVAPGTEVWGKGVYTPLGVWGDGPAVIPEWLDAEARRVGAYRDPEAPARYSAADRLRGSRAAAAAPLTDALRATVTEEAVTAVREAPAGQRNAALNAAAFKVGRALVSRDESLQSSLAQMLEDVAVQGGTPHAEARATVASGIAGGIRAAAGRK